ncbi:hypothetical protein MBLNU457_g0579t1 [Dothideomycetes sp. NU457]
MASDFLHLGLTELRWFQDSATTVFELPPNYHIDASSLVFDSFLDNPLTCPLQLPHSPPTKLYDTTVKVTVGRNDPEVFYPYLGLLTAYSGYFARALGGGFREAAEQHIRLENEEPRVFRAVFDWLNTGRLPDITPVIGQANTRPAQDVLDLLVRLWIFADMRRMPELRDGVVESLIMVSLKTATYPSASTVAWAYDNTLAGTAIRKVLVDLLILSADIQSVLTATEEGDWSTQFKQDVFIAYHKAFPEGRSTLRTAKDWERANKCAYHVHGYYEQRTV